MSLLDRAAILKFHRDRIGDFGSGSVEALGWRNLHTQTTRFEALVRIGDLAGRTVLDVGCGHGDLRGFLRANGHDVEYLGLDHLPELLDVAVERYGDWLRTRFLLGDFSSADLPRTDYVLCSGALSYRQRDPDFIPRVIEKLFRTCRLGLGFNLLRSAAQADGILVAHEPARILEVCRRLTPDVTLSEGYLPDDFTVFLYRGQIRHQHL